MKKLRVLDLFAGIGGFSLGLERTGGFETVAFCEIEEFPRKVLRKHWPDVPQFTDVRELKRSDIGAVDVICGGYPCQPFSTAGKRRGAEDDRHLWPEFSRLVAEFRPAWVIGENVAGHISMGLDDVLSDLEKQGYACRTFVIPACAVGASHRRDRVWTVAHSKLRNGKSGKVKRPELWAEADRQGANTDPCCASHKQESLAQSQSQRREEARKHSERPAQRSPRSSKVVADANDARPQGRAQTRHLASEWTWRDKQLERCGDDQGSARRVESRMGRMANGFSCWLDEPRERVKAGVKDRAGRLKALGNAVHPDIPMMIGAAIMEAERAA